MRLLSVRVCSILVLLAGLAGLVGCDGDPPPPDAGSPPDAAAPVDAFVGDTWGSYAQGFTATYCATSGCHDAAGSTLRDYTRIDDVRRDAASIRCGVAPARLADCGAAPAAQQFPTGAGARPEEADRLRFVAWIDDGLRE